jgi:hypothetical protein
LLYNLYDSEAMMDLRKALELEPDDPTIREEVQNIQVFIVGDNIIIFIIEYDQYPNILIYRNFKRVI